MSALDLRAIAREDWPKYHSCPLQIPPDVAAYIAGMDAKATVLEKDHLEERIIAFYEIVAPFTVIYRHGAARLIYDHPDA